MKKMMIMCLVLIMVSCTSRSAMDAKRSITVESITTGQVIKVVDRMSLAQMGDTIVIGLSKTRVPSVYGKYIGVIPSDYVAGSNKVTYKAFKRIK